MASIRGRGLAEERCGLAAGRRSASDAARAWLTESRDYQGGIAPRREKMRPVMREPAQYERIERLRQPDRYPRASRYDPAWVLSLDMGPHPLWQLEDLLLDLALEPRMRVLDLGAGKGATSAFLAKECDVDVVALDLWVPAEQARRSHEAAGVADRVTAVTGDVRAMPFADEEFEYSGTDVHLLPSLMRVFRPGGPIAISTPALRHDPYQVGVPAYVEAVVGWEAAAWHPPAWWARHWELSGLVEDIRARWQVGGRDDWLLWARAHGDTAGPKGLDPIITMLESDADEEIGVTLASARKRAHGTAR